MAVGPKTVTITGPSEAKVNDTVSLECSTSNSNPVARITWVLDGREVRENGSRIATSPGGGWVSSSNLTTVIRATGRNVTVSCHAVVADLAQRVAETKIISVVCKSSVSLLFLERCYIFEPHDQQIRRNLRPYRACVIAVSAKARFTN